MSRLIQLHADIDARVGAIRADRPDWTCAKGCDSCCRQLADVPQLTADEWILLRQGLDAMPVEKRSVIRRRVVALAGQSTRPLICPLLDPLTGACPVYAQRPVACRTYGFYVQRDKGLYCSAIESGVGAGDLADVVWGNHDAIDQGLDAIGQRRALTDWFSQLEDQPQFLPGETKHIVS